MNIPNQRTEKNILKHKISMSELATIFDNPFFVSTMNVPDVMQSQYEKKFHAFGWTTTGWDVIIWYTYRNHKFRIIGGRKLK